MKLKNLIGQTRRQNSRKNLFENNVNNTFEKLHIWRTYSAIWKLTPNILYTHRLGNHFLQSIYHLVR